MVANCNLQSILLKNYVLPVNDTLRQNNSIQPWEHVFMVTSAYLYIHNLFYVNNMQILVSPAITMSQYHDVAGNHMCGMDIANNIRQIILRAT